MFTTKIRTTIAMLAAVVTVGVASVPITQDASAAPNDGRYGRSGEAMRKRMLCNSLYASMKESINEALTELAKADILSKYGMDDSAQEAEERAADADKEANEALHDGKLVGCSWAA
jgi:hypothetical protein